MLSKRLGATLSVLFLSIGTFAQIGLLQNTEEAYPGYTLFHPLNYTGTFLIDNEGYVINEWPSDYPPGNSVYLLDDGDLLRSLEPPLNNLAIGGGGGVLEIVNWENERQWRMELFEGDERFHHDMKLLPNGNIIAIALERIDRATALAAGRDPDLLINDEIWSEKIIEIKPVGTSDFEIIWEWRAFDHIIQDFDDTKPNFGQVDSNPGKIDLNFVTDLTSSDWIHFNSIDYNEALDQILLSTPFWSELWVIDHSTNTSEAATSTGGLFNKGGDLLFRWGNDSAFNKEGVSSQKLFRQHNAQWVARDAENWDIVLYNNGRGRTASIETDYSTIDRIELAIDFENSEYVLDANGVYAPTDLVNLYTAPEPTSFFSSFISGVQLLPNGNTLICEGAKGNIFELNAAKEIVWNYVTPVNNELLCDTTETKGGLTFRAEKYALDYPGILENTQQYILSSSGCDVVASTEDELSELYYVQPNAVLAFHNPNLIQFVEVFDASGRLLRKKSIDNQQYTLSLSEYKEQILLLRVTTVHRIYSDKLWFD